jgi:peptidoglycan/LPS O-acetylase OafA/YrhL
MHRSLTYRPHIDGLRAIAVVGVVLFHFGARTLPGGFIGVDVFFVISGFLISKTLYREISDGEFSLASFYERRARRILPAFYAVSIASAVAALFILLPQGLVSFAKSLIAAALFSSNIFFYATSNYFAPAANEMPLIHYWSLAVEEQFYLLFPLLIVAIFRWSPRHLAVVIAILLLASLGASEAMVRVDPPAAFYLLPFRAFELLIGSLLALPGTRFPISQGVAGVSTLVGAALILGGMVAIHEDMRFPGLTALIPCLGAALVIWGSEKTTTSPAQLLGSTPIAFLGKLSYSLYLVHWPVAVFGGQLFPHADRLTFLVAGVAVSLILGWVSFRYVEQPVRLHRTLWTKRTIFSAASAALLVCILPSIVAVQAQGFPGRMSGKVGEILGYLAYDYKTAFREGVCFMRPEQHAGDLNTQVCLPSGRPQAILWGDSLVAQYYSGLRDALGKRGLQLGQLTASSCPPIVGVDIATRPNCAAFNGFAITEILKAKPDLLILGALWLGTDEQMLALDKTLKELRAAKIAVVILGPSAIFKRSVPTILAERLNRGDDSTLSDAELETDIFARDAAMRKHLSENGENGGARFVSVLDTVCSGRQCPLSYNGIPLHFDTAHLTAEGSRYYSVLLTSRLLD